MNLFLTFFLIGLGAGLPIFFVGLFFYKIFKNTFMRRGIKKMIKQGKFLVPLDVKDYDSERWKNQIDINKTSEELKNLNQKIFKKSLENGQQ